MKRKPISARIQTRAAQAVSPEAQLREAAREVFACWASGVTVLAVRDGPHVLAITATAVMPVSLEPPLILASVGLNATVLPFLEIGRRFTVNLLAGDQRRLASLFADPAPLERSAFPPEGDPVLADALASLACVVRRIHREGDHDLVVASIEQVELHDEREPLIYFGRQYRGLR
jgi:flavin reductase (DIM6/NTAB) family NADH-FMN oxidoreductase RutF